MLSQRLKQLRSENNLTQAQLADILGIAKTTLAAYEQGKSEPNIELLIKMADYFCVTVDYLIGKTNCIHEEYQPISDILGIDEKTIDILKGFSRNKAEYSQLDFLEAIIQHPQFSSLMSQISSYILHDEQGWHDAPICDAEGNISNIIPAEVMKASSMQIIQTTFKGIVEGIPYSKHFLNKK